MATNGKIGVAIVIETGDAGKVIERLGGLCYQIIFTPLNDPKARKAARAVIEQSYSNAANRPPSKPVKEDSDRSGTRSRIMNMLASSNRSAKELAKLLKVSNASIGFHLNVLKKKKAIVLRRDGNDFRYEAVKG